MNKYNIRAVRNELDDYIRNKSWKKIRIKLASLESISNKTGEHHQALLQAVVLAKSKNQHATLLHSLLHQESDNLGQKENWVATVKVVAHDVPLSLFVQDIQLQTPLHIAIDRRHDLGLVDFLLEMQKNEVLNGRENYSRRETLNVLAATDKQGDTPLLKAAKVDAGQYIGSLLRYDSHHSSVLVEGKRKKRTALWYLVSSELQHAFKYEEYDIPNELKQLLLETSFALERKKRIAVNPKEDDFKSWLQEVKTPPAIGEHLQPQDAWMIPLVGRSLVACSTLMGRHAIKLLDFLLENEQYRDFFLSKPIDGDGNFLLHLICAHDTTEQLDQSSDASLNALMLDQIVGQEETKRTISLSNQNGDMPIHLAVASQKDYVQSLLSAHPEALLHCNRQGRMPLHIALTVPVPNMPNISAFLQRIEMLWKAEPRSLQFKDGHISLYPYQLAACASLDKWYQGDASRLTEGAQKELNSEWLTLIYRLLLAAPQVVQR